MADTLTITDNRTGTQYEVPVQDDTIRATDLRQIKVKPDEFGLMTYDPAYMNTAACRSSTRCSSARRSATSSAEAAAGSATYSAHWTGAAEISAAASHAAVWRAAS